MVSENEETGVGVEVSAEPRLLLFPGNYLSKSSVSPPACPVFLLSHLAIIRVHSA